MKELERETSRLAERVATAKRDVRREREALHEAKDELSAAKRAQAILQELAEQIQQKAHTRIAAIVSRCLQAVFDEPYQFKITFVPKRGKTEAVLTFEREGIEVDPLSSSGGGVVDVAAFALRIASLVMHQPPLRRLLVLDEPFKFVSAEYRERVRELLEVLAEEMEIQFVMVTHIKELETGTVIRLS